MRIALAVVLVVLAVLLSASAGAALVQWSGNEHWYEARSTPGGIDWETASTLCAAEGGYLATITSAEENAFAFGLVSADSSLWYIDSYENGIGPWLGGLQPPGSVEPDGGWSWVTGEPWGYTNWSSGEPNDLGLDEDRVHFFGRRVLIGSEWNDINWDEPLLGYVIELDELPSPVDELTWGCIKALFAE